MAPPEKAEKRILFNADKKTTQEAIAQAQFIAFAPFVFQASLILRDSNILSFVEEAMHKGVTIDDIHTKVNFSPYAVRVLMEAGLGTGLLYREDGRYFLTKTGHVFINHEGTRVNTNFMRDVCYEGAKELNQSFIEGKPKGLKYLGDWDTIFEGLSIMPEPARSSWFNFDHYYSDNAFPAALPWVFERKPGKILDIGSNIGKFAQACLDKDDNLQIGIVDLHVQLNAAKEYFESKGYNGRVTYFPIDILDKNAVLPAGYDVMWMSQFLACFADEEIIYILRKCHEALPDNGRIFINETFWDRQRMEASAFSMQMTSLYFASIANGNSQIYDSRVYLKLVEKAGFEVVRQQDDIGLGHTLLELSKK